MLEIISLNEGINYAPVLAGWAYNQWYKERNIPYDIVDLEYRKRASSTNIPLTWVAIENNIPAGMCTLKENDLWSRKDLNPWLSALYVMPEFRNTGIAGKLVDRVIVKARELNFIRLYLFLGQGSNIDLDSFYSKHGWKYYEDGIDNDSRQTKIFYFQLR